MRYLHFVWFTPLHICFIYAVSTEEYSALHHCITCFQWTTCSVKVDSGLFFYPLTSTCAGYGTFQGTGDFWGLQCWRMKNSKLWKCCSAFIFVLFLCQAGSSQQPLRRPFFFISNWRWRIEDMNAGHTMGLAYHCILQHLEVEPMQSFCLLIVVRHSMLFCHPG